MRVTPVAYTAFNDFAASQESGYIRHLEYNPDEPVSEMDELGEFAGRNCYQSWSRPNPDTATNAGYLSNILIQGHFSVLEHSSVTFFVEDVSRALLVELERHRFLSFSVVSQRYVKQDEADRVVPPAITENFDEIARRKMYMDWTIGDLFDEAIIGAYEAYDTIAEALLAKGMPKKKALEAARAVLPNAAGVKMVVTGNLRAWRDVIGKRYHEAADAEIKAFATEVLAHLRRLAPNSVQDIPEEPYS